MPTDSSEPEPEPADPSLIDRLAAIDDSLSGRGCSEPTIISAVPAEAATDDWPSMADALDAILLLRQAAAADSGAIPPDPDLPEAVGRFRVVREAGQGGFAVVLEAYDPVLMRRVAVKLSHPEVLLSAETRGRFLREAELAARLVHPHIVAIHEVGEAAGRMFIAEEFCPDGSLAEWLEAHPGPVPAGVAARLVRALAQAAAHAHGHGIVHRDIKPANVLLTQVDTAAGETGLLSQDTLSVKLCDFGLGKAFAIDGPAAPDTQATLAGLRIGTPAWMAPEQIDSSFGQIGPATDVHALGLLLHRLLTGSCPWVGRTDAETFKQILLDEPVSPDRIGRGVPRDLGAVCMKCLAKPPADRYGSATDLAADLSRFLNGSATVARPLAPTTRLVRAVCRRPLAAGLMAAAVAAMATAAWSIRERGIETARRLEHADDVRHHEAAAELRRGFDAWRTGNAGSAMEHLAACRAIDPGLAESVAGAWLRRRTHGEKAVLLQTAWRPDGRRAAIHAFALAPDGDTIAAGAADGTLLLGRGIGGAAPASVSRLAAHDEINAVAFSPDGTRLATVGQDGAMRLWAVDGTALGPAAQAGCPLYGVAFTADGEQVVYGGQDRVVRCVAVTDGGMAAGTSRVLCDYSDHARADADIEAICRVGDGRFAVACGESVFLLDPQVTQSVRRIAALDGATARLTPSPDGAILLCVGHDPQPALCHVDDGMLAGRLPLHPAWVLGGGFSPDGRRVVTGCKDGVARVFSVANENLQQRLVGHVGRVWDAAFEPDGTVLTAGADGTLRRWDANAPPETAGLETREVAGDFVRAVLVTKSASGGQAVVFTQAGKPMQIWALDGAEPLPAEVGADATAFGFANRLAIDPLRERIAVEQGRGRVAILTESAGGIRNLTFLPGGAVPGGLYLTWTPDGMLIVGSGDGRVMAWDTSLAHAVALDHFEHAIDAVSACPTGDGRVAAGSRKEFAVYRLLPAARSGEAPTFSQLFRLDILPADLQAIAWSPDGTRLACATNAGFVILFDAATGKRIGTLAAHEHDVVALAYSPDGRTLVSADKASVRFSDSLTLALFDELRLGWRITSLHVAGDGQTIAIGGHTNEDAAHHGTPRGCIGIIDLRTADGADEP